MDLPSADWNHLRAFLATVEQGSLSAAARKLGLTQPTLSRQITALEAALDLMLFERNGRHLSLTDAGRELLVHVSEMGALRRGCRWRPVVNARGWAGWCGSPPVMLHRCMNCRRLCGRSACGHHRSPSKLWRQMTLKT
ncbi:LysR family transcriptional regulator [Sulfitobacter pacificus]|uniref:LysR family transcriptional regulator n=1 Tax=Sulfitobacter pacificus TaxID=1499314 RepID=UPI00360B71E9